MSYLAFYDSTLPRSLAAAWLVKYSSTYGDSTKFVDTAGLDASGMAGLISGEDPDSYDQIFVLVGQAAAHVAGAFTNDQIASLDGLLVTANKGTATDNKVTSGTAQTNSTKTNIVLASTASDSNDTYNGMFIVTAGTTAVYRAITDYVGSSKTATVVDTGTAITNTETYIVYTLDNVFQLGNLSGGKSVAERTWDALYPNTQKPLLIHYLSENKLFDDFGTAQANNGTTVTLAATGSTGSRVTSPTNDVFNNMYLYVYSATTGKNGYAKITDFVQSTRVATVTLPVTPTGTLVYRIVRDLHRVFCDLYTELFFKTYFHDLTDVAAADDFAKLIDLTGVLNTQKVKHTDEDEDLFNAYLLKGKAIQDYLGL